MNTAVVWRVFLKFNHFVESGIKIFHYSHQVKLVLFKLVGLQIFRGKGREKNPILGDIGFEQLKCLFVD